MIGSSSLYKIENRIRRAIYYNYSKIINCNAKILNNISTLPFGGIHVLFSGQLITFIIIEINLPYILLIGDFYQLLCIKDRSLIYERRLSNSVEINAGRKLWECINYFKELKHNFRADTNDIDTKFYVQFLQDARLGKVKDIQLTRINGSCLQTSMKEAMYNTRNNTKSIWLTNTKANRKKVNDSFKESLKEKIINFPNNTLNEKNLTIDIICKHEYEDKRIIDSNRSKILHKYSGDGPNGHEIAPAILSLSIGTRVQVIGNIATEIGIIIYKILNIVKFYHYYTFIIHRII